MFFRKPDRDDAFHDYHGIKPLRAKCHTPITRESLRKLLLSKPLTNARDILLHFCPDPQPRHFRRLEALK